jgi:hypothetical protein
MGKKFIITESEKKEILSLYGIINEQDLTYKREELPSDYLGPKGSFEKNYTPQVYTANVGSEKQVEKAKEQKRIEDEAKSLIATYSKKLPKTEYYTSNNEIFKEWVVKKIESLNFLKYLEENTLQYSKDFFKKYFDYNSNPAIIQKIINIATKNGSLMVGEDRVKKTIDKLLSEYFNKIKFELDFEYNKEKPNTQAYVYSFYLDGKIYICVFGGLIKDNYEFESIDYLKETVLHELGHLVDGYFNMMGIKFYSSDGGEVDTKNKSEFPHANIVKDFLKIDSTYLTRTSEQFTRLKILFDILSKEGYKAGSSFDEFTDSILFAIHNERLSFGGDGCNSKINGDYILINEDCPELSNFTENDKDLSIWSDLDDKGWESNISLEWLFQNYAIINFTSKSPEKVKVDLKYDLKKLYNDMVNEYVENVGNSSSDSPNYPTT